ncbi:MAG: sigma-70 family RNA polymerase sigma factor [Clostridia bacterium]|nr:sigma-70 family RNA polymerase sigma factor [Clostridia bacterium]
MGEAEWIRLSQKGDMDAFSQLVSLYEKRVVNFAYRMLKDTHEAEDAAQEAFLRAWKHINSFRPEASFHTWILSIVNRICLDILRKKKRTGEQTHISIHQAPEGEDEYAIQIEDTAPGPDEVYRQKTAMQLVEQAIGELSEEHRAVILMRDINGLEYDEIAKATGASLGTVKSRLNRARMALRKILEKNMELFS